MRYRFIVDLNERGLFAAHVIDTDTDEFIAWWTTDECEEYGGFPPIIGGFMRNIRDMSGLAEMLGLTAGIEYAG
jgi:hypothetical protein